MVGSLRARTRRVAVWAVMLALTALPFAHTHAGVAWSHAGAHAHPPVMHSVFASDEAHPAGELDLLGPWAVLATASHGLGQEIVRVSGAPPMVFGVVSPLGALPGLTWTPQRAPAGASPSIEVFEASTAPRAPPVFLLS